jgi:signal transduction histidine kinase
MAGSLQQDIEATPAEEYEAALRNYVTEGSEEALLSAYSIGRRMIGEGLPALLALHGSALRTALPARPSGAQLGWIVDRATQFLIEASAPFELAFSGVREANERLRHANVELERADSLKNQFLAHMSHELRTPLNSILGFSDLLLSGSAGQLDARQMRYLNHISAGGKQLLNLVNEILDLSKIRAGLMELSIEQVAVDEVVDQCTAQIRPLADFKEIVLGVDVEAGLKAAADPHRLEQVLLNLLSNAVKFTPERGSVWIRGWPANGHAAISVSDTGIGIPPEEQARVFEEFTQVDQDGIAPRQGTGLGLAVSRRLVDLMEGKLTLESEPGRGSTFTILLPTPPPAARGEGGVRGRPATP